MDLQSALDIVVARTRHGRYRELCDPAHPDYNPAVVDYVLRRAGELDGSSPPTPREPPRAVAAPPSMLAGDIIAAFTARVGADRAAKWIAKQLTGIPNCGCEARRIALNNLDAKIRNWLGLGSP